MALFPGTRHTEARWNSGRRHRGKGGGTLKQPLHANATATETIPFDTPGCDEANTFHVSLTVDRRKLLSSWTTALLSSWTASPLSSRTASPLEDRLTAKLEDRFTTKLEDRFTAKLEDRFTAKLVDRFTAKLEDSFTAKLVERFTAKLEDCFTAKLVDRLTAIVLVARGLTAKLVSRSTR